MSKKRLFAILGLVLCIAVVWLGVRHFVRHTPSRSSTPAKVSTAPKPQTSVPKTTTITQASFQDLPRGDQTTLRNFVSAVRHAGFESLTPAACSILTVGDTHFVLTSYWDKDYTFDPSVWKLSNDDSLWNPNLKTALSKAGAWTIAYMTDDKEVYSPNVLLRWIVPPIAMENPPAAPTEPVEKACLATWQEVLKQKYPSFYFTKVTAAANNLQLHFTAIQNNRPEKIVVSVPIEGTYAAFHLGPVSIARE